MNPIPLNDSVAAAGAPNGVAPNDPIDLSSCDRMEVRFPAAILPHGALLVLPRGATRVAAASENVQALLGVAVEQLLGQELEQLFEARLVAAARADIRPGREHLGRFGRIGTGDRFDVFVRDAGEWRLLELEPIQHGDASGGADQAGALDILNSIGDYIDELKIAPTPEAVAEVALRSIQALTGYDSILYLHFRSDRSLHCTAEVSNGRLLSVLDKRFPASDVPDPARRNLRTLPMVYVPDITYTPVPLRALAGGPDLHQLDLGQARLRSLSNVCNRFYLNVGVKGKLVIPLREDAAQHALIVCWSEQPREISHTARELARTIAELAGQLIREKTRAEERDQLLRTGRAVDLFLDAIANAPVFEEGLRRLPEFLLTVMDASGAAYWSDQDWVGVGLAPSRRTLDELAARVPNGDSFHVSNSEPLLLTQAEPARDDRLAGVVAFPLLLPGQYVAVFRQEWEMEVKWAGNPAKPVEVDADTRERRLTPRGSFDLWKESVRGQARPWSATDIEMLQRLRASVTMLQAQHVAREANTEKSRFLSVISHEIRSPLNAVSGFTRMLQREPLTFHQNELLGRLEGGVGHMLNVVNGVLDLSRIEAGRMQLEATDFSLSGAVRTALDIVSEQAREKGLDLGVDLARVPDRLVGDPTRLAQMLLNYLGNAVKFTERGRVTVTAQPLAEQPDQIHIRFEVSDTGKGLTEEQMERLFAVYGQAESHIYRVHGGSGLGLVITRNLARLMGGDAGVESQVGRGSTFWFTCWLGRAAAATSEAPAAPRQDDAGEPVLARLKKLASGKRALLVDDEPINQMIGEDMLANAGFAVVTAGSAEEAIDILREQTFDLVLMDTFLPGMNGIEAARIILADPAHRALPIVALTGDALSETRHACLDAGMRAFLSKPVMPAHFHETLLHCLQP